MKETGGLVGPHTFYALPGRMLIRALSNAKDGGGRTGARRVQQRGQVHPDDLDARGGAVYGYDVRVNVNLNRMLTSSFAGRKNYMRPIGELLKDAEAMKQFGTSVIVWDFHARKPLQVLAVPGAPLELRWALAAESPVRLHLDRAHRAARADPPAGGRHVGDQEHRRDRGQLPVDISIAPDDSKIYVNSFGDGTMRVYDVTNPFEGKLIEQVKLGEQANMVSTSWDGQRVYATTRCSRSGTSPAISGSRPSRGRTASWCRSSPPTSPGSGARTS